MSLARNIQLGALFLLLLLLILGGLAGGWFLAENEYLVEFDGALPEEITLEYGESYAPPQVTAYCRSTKIPAEPEVLEVSCTGSVDETTLGSYTLTFAAACDRAQGQKTQTVHVVDTKAPIITLMENPDAYTLPGQPYEEEGFAASDNYDGDLTASVKAEEKDGVVTYTVTDSSGNTAKVTRTIRYDDPVAPEITLEGGDTIYVILGYDYQEPGYQATDNVDGDLTDQVVVEGVVDADTEGSYTLTYTVTDSYENTTTVKRTVQVSKPQPPKPQEPEHAVGGVVYLTFDDGPSQHTDRLLDVLAKYNVKATFFVVNTPYISKVSRIAAEGHTVALHTATHEFSQVYASDEAYFADLQVISDAVERYTGQKSMLIRFPGGSSNTISRAYCEGIMTRLTKEVQRRGYHYFDWNVDSYDAGGAYTSDEVYHNVINGISTSRTSIVLQHDLWGWSVDAVERIIQWGQAHGYTFLPLTADSPGCHHGVNN